MPLDILSKSYKNKKDKTVPFRIKSPQILFGRRFRLVGNFHFIWVVGNDQAVDLIDHHLIIYTKQAFSYRQIYFWYLPKMAEFHTKWFLALWRL